MCRKICAFVQRLLLEESRGKSEEKRKEGCLGTRLQDKSERDAEDVKEKCRVLDKAEAWSSETCN